ncbi:MAG: hypothetical protein HYX76_10770 [Acidobacteria bacterium]|nr:hypothetical protein [Acidobacteriota bacterium]
MKMILLVAAKVAAGLLLAGILLPLVVRFVPIVGNPWLAALLAVMCVMLMLWMTSRKVTR